MSATRSYVPCLLHILHLISLNSRRIIMTRRMTTAMTPTSRKMASRASRASRASQRRATVRTPRHSDYSDFRLIGRSHRLDRPLARLAWLGGATPARILRWISSIPVTPLCVPLNHLSRSAFSPYSAGQDQALGGGMEISYLLYILRAFTLLLYIVRKMIGYAIYY